MKTQTGKRPTAKKSTTAKKTGKKPAATEAKPSKIVPQGIPKAIPDVITQHMEFGDNSVLAMLYGDGDAHLQRVEKKLGVTIRSRGNIIEISGNMSDVYLAQEVLTRLYDTLEKGGDIGATQVDAAMRLAAPPAPATGSQKSRRQAIVSDVMISTLKRTVTPYSRIQEEYIQAMQKNDLVFALGPAGTGKTYIAVAMAVSMFLSRRVERIILSRPAVEAGEKLGFLPGDLKEKIDPYLRPLYDALYDMIPGEKVQHYLLNGEIEVAPLAFMRGRTLSNAFVILDEAQNTTATQMKMFLTRMGENSRMVVTGDLTQTDLPRDVASGLRDAVRKVEHIEGIARVRFSDVDVVRHPLAAKIVQAYDEWDRKKKQPPAAE